MSPERKWWLSLPGVLVSPRSVFAALREQSQPELDARQEPVLALVLLAGMGGVLATSTAGSLADSWEYDAALIAVWTFVAGALYGFVGYFVIGGALYLGARGLGGLGDYRRARHVVAFAAAPLALSLLTLRPVELLAFGGDSFRSGGSDEGAAAALFLGAEVGFGLWAAALLLVGTRTVHGWTWTRSVGALGLVALFLAAFAYLPSVLG
ncbi:MAG TPA: YIP1 family protein [Gaiellaceae bacterium]|nr:YIP1 family protein [Gaiellaceae bacterium]